MGYTAEDEILIKEKWDQLLKSCEKVCKNEEDWNFIKRAFFLAKEAHEGVASNFKLVSFFIYLGGANIFCDSRSASSAL